MMLLMCHLQLDVQRIHWEQLTSGSRSIGDRARWGAQVTSSFGFQVLLKISGHQKNSVDMHPYVCNDHLINGDDAEQQRRQYEEGDQETSNTWTSVRVDRERSEGTCRVERSAVRDLQDAQGQDVDRIGDRVALRKESEHEARCRSRRRILHDDLESRWTGALRESDGERSTSCEENRSVSNAGCSDRVVNPVSRRYHAAADSHRRLFFCLESITEQQGEALCNR